MQKSAVVALALLESASAFQAPAMKPLSAVKSATMFAEGDLGVLPPLGVYDPLGLIETRNMFRYGARRRPLGPPGPRSRAAARARRRPPPAVARRLPC